MAEPMTPTMVEWREVSTLCEGSTIEINSTKLNGMLTEIEVVMVGEVRAIGFDCTRILVVHENSMSEYFIFRNGMFIKVVNHGA